MPESRVCIHCGVRFTWTDKEEKEHKEIGDARLEDDDPKDYCKSCRPKQDQQSA